MDDTQDSEEALVSQATQRLRSLLGPDWQVVDVTSPEAMAPRSFFDARLQVTPPDRSRYTEVLLSTYHSLTPRAVEQNVGPIHEVLAQTSNPPTLLVVAPWLSRRTQDELRIRGIGYLDLTGNIDWSVPAPAIRILTQGSTKAPKVDRDGNAKTVTLAGPRAGRVIRFLTDFQPPYRATQIADVTGTSLPWVSRLLGQLEDQLLISRDGRSIVKTDWEGLLRARAETYSLLRANSFVGMTSPHGPRGVLRDLRELMSAKAPKGDDNSIAVTGPLASRAVAPLTTGGQLMLFVPAGPHTPDIWAERLGLLRTDDAADVLILRAYDDIVFSHTRQVDGVPHVALPQLVLDGLGGPGRMPAEAEAVIQHMAANTNWRTPWNME